MAQDWSGGQDTPARAPARLVLAIESSVARMWTWEKGCRGGSHRACRGAACHAHRGGGRDQHRASGAHRSRPGSRASRHMRSTRGAPRRAAGSVGETRGSRARMVRCARWRSLASSFWGSRRSSGSSTVDRSDGARARLWTSVATRFTIKLLATTRRERSTSWTRPGTRH